MACRVGMSKDPETRIQHWKNTGKYTHGKVLHRGLTYDQATAKEESEAKARGCEYHPGGERDSSHSWCVYYVWKQ